MFTALLVLSIILLTQNLGGISVACGIAGIIVGGIGFLFILSLIIVEIIGNLIDRF